MYSQKVERITGFVFKDEYPAVDMDGKQYRIHRIVAETFIPNPSGKPEVNHIDGNKQNNNVTNLEWATRLENAVHASTHGLLHSSISDETGKKILKEFEENPKVSYMYLMKKYKCERGAIVHLLKREGKFKKRFRYLEDEEIDQIVYEYLNGNDDAKEIARKHDIHAATVYNCLKRRNINYRRFPNNVRKFEKKTCMN